MVFPRAATLRGLRLERVVSRRPGMSVDSDSMGDPARFRTLEELEAGLQALPTGARDRGRVALIVSR